MSDGIPTAVVEPFGLVEAEAVRRDVLQIDPAADDFVFFAPLYAYWRDRSEGRAGPARAEIDPLHLPPALLPHLVMIDVQRDPLDFRYRLAGTTADHIHGKPLTGVRVLDLKPRDFAELLNRDLVRMAETLEPQFVRHSFTNQEGQTRRFRVLRMPLCDAEGRLAIVLVLSEFGALAR